ncbi:MAG: 4-hydroxy-tetrahydrodipicolinate reductase [Halobacteriales archaeon]|nr:4-hydroxy-tetrahydrodipicolinate reductase [Halobacteriales archaeon]
MTTKVVVVGATGRTGSLVVEVARGDDAYEYIGGVAGEARDGKVVGFDEARALFEEADVVVDFSTPEATKRAAELARETRTPLVTGTTALDETAEDALAEAARTVPVVRSSNFARGVNVFWEVVERTASLLPGADFEVTETHHRGKLDAPSGTAKETVERIENAVGEREHVHGRKGDAKRGDEIGVHARRAGDVVGEHEVLVAEGDESLTLTHRASDRRAFASGALDAAVWALEAEPGDYGMDDVLNL